MLSWRPFGTIILSGNIRVTDSLSKAGHYCIALVIRIR